MEMSPNQFRALERWIKAELRMLDPTQGWGKDSVAGEKRLAASVNEHTTALHEAWVMLTGAGER